MPPTTAAAPAASAPAAVAAAEGDQAKNGATYQPRGQTAVEEAVSAEYEAGHDLLERLSTSASVSGFRPELSGAIFCGHLVADQDSVAGALGASELYGGTPARASEVNSETEWALEYWGVPNIPYVEDLVKECPDSKICLVDFQQKTQLHECIRPDKVCGIIDHHALQNATIVTEKPVFVDIRPWGSMSTILAYEFAAQRAYLPRPVAGMLLSAVLSDTLNLRSPTTTEWDRRVVSMLCQYCGVDDVNLLATQQFKAKSRALSKMSAYELASGDRKQFKFDGVHGEHTVAYAVVETTDAPAILARTDELVPEMRAIKRELAAKGPCTCFFLAVVDIVGLRSHLLLLGEAERSLAAAAYGGPKALDPEVAAIVGEDASRHVYDLGDRVSRKADFVPPLTAACRDWKLPMVASKSEKDLVAAGQVTVDFSDNPSGTIVRK